MELDVANDAEEDRDTQEETARSEDERAAQGGVRKDAPERTETRRVKPEGARGLGARPGDGAKGNPPPQEAKTVEDLARTPVTLGVVIALGLVLVGLVGLVYKSVGDLQGAVDKVR